MRWLASALLALGLAACDDDGCRYIPGTAQFSFFITTYVMVGQIAVPINTPIYSYEYECPDGTKVRR
jgi:hypothetical protein